MNMAKYLHKYQSESAFKPDYDGEFYHEPWVSLTKGVGNKEYGRVDYNKNPRAVPLTFRMRESGTFVIGDPASEWAGGPIEGDVVHYSINDGPWQDFTYVPNTQAGYGWETLELQVNEGDTIAFKATLPDRGSYGDFGLASNDSNIHYDVYGNIMSIVDEKKYPSMTDFPSSWERPAFTQFFAGAGVVDAGGLILPLKHVPSMGYALMFAGSSLEVVPLLEAETVDANCPFGGMFADTNISEIPEDYFMGIKNVDTADTGWDINLFNFCGTTLFARCVLLVKAPALPNLPEFAGHSDIYSGIFLGCTSLNHVKSYFPGIDWGTGEIDASAFGLNSRTTYPSGGVLEVPAESVSKVVGLPNGWTVQAIED